MFKRLLPILIALGIAGAFASTLAFLVIKSMEPAETYRTEQPATRDIVVKTVAAGSVVPRNEVELKARVSGIVDAVAVEPGDDVTAGELIAEIRIVPDVVSLNNASSAVASARIERNEAQAALDRAEQLHGQGAISSTEFDRSTTAMALAHERHEAAISNLELVREGVSRRTGNVSTQVRSTVDGMVLLADIEPGQSVIESNTFNEGTTIAIVADMTDMIFEGRVDESEVGKLTEGMDLQIRIGAIDDRTFDGTLEYIAPKGLLEEGAVQFEIRAALKVQVDTFIRAGSSANADIVLDRSEGILTVRESALEVEGTEVFVHVQTAPQVFERRQIEVGISDGIHIEVVSGLDPSTTIRGARQP